MSSVYTFTGKETSPNWTTQDGAGVILSGIYKDVEDSTMADKTPLGHRWDESTGILEIFYPIDISVDDQAKLDVIVGANISE
jgi:hypothetical protein